MSKGWVCIVPKCILDTTNCSNYLPAKFASTPETNFPAQFTSMPGMPRHNSILIETDKDDIPEKFASTPGRQRPIIQHNLYSPYRKG